MAKDKFYEIDNINTGGGGYDWYRRSSNSNGNAIW